MDSWDAFPTEAPMQPTPADAGPPSMRLTVTPSSETWDDFPDKKPSNIAATAKDVAKSAGIGVAKGIIGTLGAPADLVELGARGIDRATQFVGKGLGLDTPPREDRKPDYGSEDIQKAVEDQTGEFYKPQTVAGEYAQTVGEFVPTAVAGPGGIARKIALQAVAPGIASEAAGQATKGTALEPYARAGAAIAGGLGASALARPNSATAALQARLPAGVTQQTVSDARQLMVDAKSKGIDLTWPEALSKVAGKPVLTDTQRILESAPQSRTRMQEVFGDRPQQFDRAALDEFGKIAPGTPNPSSIGRDAGRAADETIGGVRSVINDASEPYYKAAESVLLTPQEMMLVRSIPGYKDARKAVRNSPQLNSYVAHLPENSVGFLNEVKKYFDQQGKNASSKFNPAANQQVQAVHEKAASAIKQIAELKSPDYAEALAIQQQARNDYLQPLIDGPLGRLAKKDVTTRKAIDVLFPSDPLPNSHNEIATAVTALASKNPGAATQLVRAHLESVWNEATRTLQGGPNQAGAAGFAKALVGNPQQRTNLQAAIESLPKGRDLWAGFDPFLQAAEASGTRQAKGSLTAFNEAELKGLSGGNAIGETVKTGLSPGKWWSVVNDKWGQWKLGKNLDQLAAILTDPKSAPTLKRIANMPRGGREAGYLVSRLILQGKQAAMQPGESQR